LHERTRGRLTRPPLLLKEGCREAAGWFFSKAQWFGRYPPIKTSAFHKDTVKYPA